MGDRIAVGGSESLRGMIGRCMDRWLCLRVMNAVEAMCMMWSLIVVRVAELSFERVV